MALHSGEEEEEADFVKVAHTIPREGEKLDVMNEMRRRLVRRGGGGHMSRDSWFT